MISLHGKLSRRLSLFAVGTVFMAITSALLSASHQPSPSFIRFYQMNYINHGWQILAIPGRGMVVGSTLWSEPPWTNDIVLFFVNLDGIVEWSRRFHSSDTYFLITDMALSQDSSILACFYSFASRAPHDYSVVVNLGLDGQLKWQHIYSKDHSSIRADSLCQDKKGVVMSGRAPRHGYLWLSWSSMSKTSGDRGRTFALRSQVANDNFDDSQLFLDASFKPIVCAHLWDEWKGNFVAYLIAKLDRNANPLWSIRVPHSFSAAGLFRGDHIVIAGRSPSASANPNAITILCLSPLGKRVWEYTIELTNDYRAECITELPDGSLCLALAPAGGNNKDQSLLLSIDETGRVQWGTSFAHDNYSFSLKNMQVDDDGSIYAVGSVGTTLLAHADCFGHINDCPLVQYEQPAIHPSKTHIEAYPLWKDTWRLNWVEGDLEITEAPIESSAECQE